MITLALFFHKAPEAAGYGTFIAHMDQPFLKRLSYLTAYSISSPISAFCAYSIFALSNEAAIDDPYARECLNWWMGFTLLIAVGTLNYITLMHILREVFFEEEGSHEDHDHFGNGAGEENQDMVDEKHATDYRELQGGEDGKDSLSKNKESAALAGTSPPKLIKAD